jgi:anthranilate phosphoribosyltransferase
MVSVVRDLHPQRDVHVTDGRPTANMVGTGGGRSTFNITTTASFVVAAAGVVVVKTGSRACRSKSGFTDVATKLGTLKLAMPWELIESIANRVGIVFIPESYYAPALEVFEQNLTLPIYRNVATYLTKIGPLLSPVKVDHRFIGANSASCMEMLAGACQLLGDTPSTLVSSVDGLDEVSTMARTAVIHLNAGGGREEDSIDPCTLGIHAPEAGSLRGHAPAEAAECCERILSGNGTAAQTEIVALNAAAVLTSLGLYPDLPVAFQVAVELLNQGKALRKLHELRAQVWK